MLFVFHLLLLFYRSDCNQRCPGLRHFPGHAPRCERVSGSGWCALFDLDTRLQTRLLLLQRRRRPGKRKEPKIVCYIRTGPRFSMSAFVVSRARFAWFSRTREDKIERQTYFRTIHNARESCTIRSPGFLLVGFFPLTRFRGSKNTDSEISLHFQYSRVHSCNGRKKILHFSLYSPCVVTESKRLISSSYSQFLSSLGIPYPGEL